MDVLVILLAHGLNINQGRVSYGLNYGYVVDTAAAFGRLDILKFLIEIGGESMHPGMSGFDLAFLEAYKSCHSGTLMFLEQHTGFSTTAVVASLKAKRKELRWVDDLLGPDGE
ncbi:uncharacterized protein PG998_004531 [Apiospora kogelbergensis]|uniref:uncharacterized protein n=1 Tax=Apiospora kogelbergensis TaxID=1337665 RepID=UPI00312DFBE7